MRIPKASAFLCWAFFIAPLAALGEDSIARPTLKIEVAVKQGLAADAKDGRLFIIISRTNNPEPRLTLARTGRNAPVVIARDIQALGKGTNLAFEPKDLCVRNDSGADSRTHDPSRSTFHASRIPYTVQALFDSNQDLRSPNAPGNLYSRPQTLDFAADGRGNTKLELSQEIQPDQLPPETAEIKFVKLQSKLLSDFHHRPIFLRAGIVLPRDYEREISRRYTIWVRVGGLNARYSTVSRLMASDSEFRKMWLSNDTPRVILVQLDGAGPYGDPYQVNSANNGPYGDAITQELIPHIEARFRALGLPRGRVLSGASTGGWVSLALQIFYPEFFNGAWSECPDPVDFRALELVDIYKDENFYVNRHGYERSSARDAKGDVTLTLRDEVAMEKRLGHGNNFALSGEQWGEWNAAFSPRGPDRFPRALFDAETGKIDRAVAEQWKKYDLRLVLERHWKSLGPKLRGKLHIASGEADQLFLNNAVHLLDQFLSRADPPFEGKIVYGPGKTHGWTNLSLREMLGEMTAAAEQRAETP